MNAPVGSERHGTAEQAEALEYFDTGRGKAALWFGFLGGGAAWFVHLNVTYSLVRHACASGESWPLHVASVAAIAVAAAAVYTAWASWRRIGRPHSTRGEGTLGRTRLIAAGGMALSGFFLAVIVLSWVPEFVLSPCPGSL